MKSLDAYAEYLAEQHKQDQESIAAQLALSLYPLWSLMQFQELDSSTITWLTAALPIVKTAFLQSQRVGAVFIQNVRFATLPLEEPLPIVLPDVERPLGVTPEAFFPPDSGDKDPIDILEEFDRQEVATDLTIQANYETKKAMPGPEEELMNNALVRSSGAAIKQAMQGSRGVTKNLLKSDPRVIGYARVTDSNPCHFCALLASQGAMYQKDSFAPGNKRRRTGRKSDADFTSPSGNKDLPKDWLDIAKVHNNCKCTLRPVYSKSQSMDPAARYFKQGWDDITTMYPKLENQEHINKFRSWLKKNPFPVSQFDLNTLQSDLNDRYESLINAGFSPTSPQAKWAVQQRFRLAA